MCHNDLDNFENWNTRLICYGTSTPRVLALESCYSGSNIKLKDYFLAFWKIFIELDPGKRDIQQQSAIVYQ